MSEVWLGKDVCVFVLDWQNNTVVVFIGFDHEILNTSVFEKLDPINRVLNQLKH